MCPAQGFFGLWSFGRSSKQTGSQSKKATDLVTLKTLELTGDLIGHSGAVQVCFRLHLLLCSNPGCVCLEVRNFRVAYVTALHKVLLQFTGSRSILKM